MIKPINIINQSCCRVLYSLELAYLIVGQTVQETVTVVQSTRNEGVNKNLRSIKAEKFPSVCELRNFWTTDCFSEWPNDALLEVAEKYLEAMELGDDEVIL